MAKRWKEVQPAGDIDKNWIKCLSSKNGEVLVALHDNDINEEGGNIIYVSTDSGVTWNNRTPAWVNFIDMNEDGSAIFISCYYAGTQTFDFYVSTDYGESWVNLLDKPSPGNTNFAVAISNDSNILYVSIGDDISGYSLYKGIGYTLPGNPWSKITIPKSNKPIISISVDETGVKIIICYNDEVYLSVNSGVSWIELNPEAGLIGVSEFWSVSMNNDGQKLIVCFTDDIDYYESKFISINGGEDWSLKLTSGIDTIVSRDGTKIIEAREWEPRYSIDDGSAWILFYPDLFIPGPPPNYFWYWSSTVNDNNMLTGNIPREGVK